MKSVPTSVLTRRGSSSSAKFTLYQVGENGPLSRARIREWLGFLGIEMSEERNAENAPLIFVNTVVLNFGSFAMTRNS